MQRYDDRSLMGSSRRQVKEVSSTHTVDMNEIRSKRLLELDNIFPDLYHMIDAARIGSLKLEPLDGNALIPFLIG
jgi:hypothetical protein